MTVAELIAALKEMPQQAEIVSRNQWFDWDEPSIELQSIRVGLDIISEKKDRVLL